MILHGYGAGGFIQQAFLKLSNLADDHDALVLAPDGTADQTGRQFWNADPACCDFALTGVDDVAYLGGVLDDVIAAWPVDTAQVQLIGHSNGSFMAFRMACDRADVVTGIFGLAGLGPSVACEPSRAVHVLHMHGTSDDTIPYEGGNMGQVRSPGAIETVDAWAMRNGCTGTASDIGRKDLDDGLAGEETLVRQTAGCPADGAVELWTIENGEHAPSLSSTAFPAELMGWLDAHTR